MTSKNCTKCLESKPLTDFGYHKLGKYKKTAMCRKCLSVYNIEYYRTKTGLPLRIHSGQKSISKKRGHVKPNYTLDELRAWMLSQEIYHELFNKWVASSYSKNLTPSCDRIDDYKPYTLSNLQLMTWKENLDKSYKDVRAGILNKNRKRVVQMNIDGTYVETYHAMKEAGIANNVGSPCIGECCNKKRKTAGGYRWMIALDHEIHNNSKSLLKMTESDLVNHEDYANE